MNCVRDVCRFLSMWAQKVATPSSSRSKSRYSASAADGAAAGL